jgi:hypothetical protein
MQIVEGAIHKFAIFYLPNYHAQSPTTPTPPFRYKFLLLPSPIFSLSGPFLLSYQTRCNRKALEAKPKEAEGLSKESNTHQQWRLRVTQPPLSKPNPTHLTPSLPPPAKPPLHPYSRCHAAAAPPPYPQCTPRIRLKTRPLRINLRPRRLLLQLKPRNGASKAGSRRRRCNCQTTPTRRTSSRCSRPSRASLRSFLPERRGT